MAAFIPSARGNPRADVRSVAVVACCQVAWPCSSFLENTALSSIQDPVDDYVVFKTPGACACFRALKHLDCLQAIVTGVSSCICVLSTSLCFTLCIVGLVGLVACGVLAAAGMALLVFGASIFVVAMIAAAVTGTASLVAFTCTFSFL